MKNLKLQNCKKYILYLQAKKFLSEQNEDCNEMKRMVNYAMCVTIRDK